MVKDLGKDGMCSGKALISHIGRISTCLLYSDSFLTFLTYLIPIAMPVLLNNICPGKHHPGYGISSGKLWKLRAAVNYALAAGKLVQVQRFCFRTGMAM